MIGDWQMGRHGMHARPLPYVARHASLLFAVWTRGKGLI
jgi:hypothetical protein